MVVLKKIRSSTLLETLVASSIIVAVFVVGTLSVNNVYFGTLRNDTQELYNYMNELEYHAIHGNISLPYYENTEEWDISIEQKGETVVLEILNRKNRKTIKKRIGE